MAWENYSLIRYKQNSPCFSMDNQTYILKLIKDELKIIPFKKRMLKNRIKKKRKDRGW